MKKNQKGFVLIELMIVVAILGILLAVLVPFGLRLFTDKFSDGARVGELVKFTNSGVFCKTFEAELKLQEGGSSEGDNGRWAFTVDRPELVEAFKQALGKRVKVAYFQKGTNINRCTGDSTYRAQSVELLK